MCPDWNRTVNGLRSGKYSGSGTSALARVIELRSVSAMAENLQLARAVHFDKIVKQASTGIFVTRVSCVSCPQGRLGVNQGLAERTRETEQRFGEKRNAESDSAHGTAPGSHNNKTTSSRLLNDPGGTDTIFVRS